MIYINKRGLLSRSLSGYVVADTSNATGFRPQYTRLGTELSAVSRLPNWKAAAAARDAGSRRQAAMNAGLQRAAMIRASMVDAHARGDRTQVRMAGLGSLGTLDPNGTIVSGGQYFFHMGCGGIFIGCPQNMNDVNQSLAGDSNFSNVQASPESTGFVVSFTYTGAGGGYSSIQSVGMEMAQVISSNLTGLQSISFLSADGPVSSGSPASSAPGSGYTPPPPPAQGFNWTQLLASMGLSGAAGAAIVLVGVFLLVRR